MRAELLDVITARFNPLRWETPDRHYRRWVEHMLDSQVKLTVCELQYGHHPFACDLPHVNHIGLRANSWCWSKENLLSIAFRRLPHARYICWEDADVFHRNTDWAVETVEALQHYRIVQTWTQCLDMGPKDEVLSVHRSLGDLYLQGELVAREDDHMRWRYAGGSYEYGHPGFSWACRRELLEKTGGFLDAALIGSADYHMALGVIGLAEASFLQHVSESYEQHVLAWQAPAAAFVNGRLGAVKGTIEHRFHGRKHDRRYINRWDMFVKHRFDPLTDIKINMDGIIEWAGNKPELERDWRHYMHTRNEDANTL